MGIKGECASTDGNFGIATQIKTNSAFAEQVCGAANQYSGQMSNKETDAPNEVVSQAVEEPKSSSDVDIDDIPTDLDEVGDVEEMSDNEEDQISHDKEVNTNENVDTEITPGSTQEAEAAMEGNDQEETDENMNTLEHIEAPSKLFKLPTSRIKSIVKLIPSVHMVNSEATAVIGKATELFLKELVSESYQVTRESGKKTLAIGHIEGVIQTLPQFEFLDGMLV
nr:DNA polymerase epsilon subunit 4 [Hymenolepis microstoma]